MTTKTDLIRSRVALKLRGKLYVTDPAAPSGRRRIVIQKTKPGLGNAEWDRTNTIQIREVPDFIDPATPAQLAQRARFTAGNAAWQALTTEEKATWNTRAAKGKRSGHQLFLSSTVTGVVAAALTEWDKTVTTWDDGATTWAEDWDKTVTTWDDGQTAWQ